MTANQALDDAGVAIENLLGGEPRRKDPDWIPFVVYSALEFARIGLDEDCAAAGELIHLLALAPDHHSALRFLAAGRYNHPTRAEELLNATETLAAKWDWGSGCSGERRRIRIVTPWP